MLVTYMKIPWWREWEIHTVQHLYEPETIDCSCVFLHSTIQACSKKYYKHSSACLLLLTLLRTLWQKAMSGSKLFELNSSKSESSDRRRLAFTRYTLETYGMFHTPLKHRTDSWFTGQHRQTEVNDKWSGSEERCYCLALHYTQEHHLHV